MIVALFTCAAKKICVKTSFMQSDNRLIFNTCPSPEQCKHATELSDALERELSRQLSQLELPAKVKIAIAGCSRCCTMPKIRDLGLIATPKGWKLYFGGNGGNRARIGDLIEKNLSSEEAVRLSYSCLQIYSTYASPRMRTSYFLEKYGISFFKEKLLF